MWIMKWVERISPSLGEPYDQEFTQEVSNKTEAEELLDRLDNQKNVKNICLEELST